MLYSNVYFLDGMLFLNVFSELLNNLNFSKLIKNVFFKKISFFWLKSVCHVLGVIININVSKIGCFGLKSNRI